jgi:dTDP-4-dehydrorhamnose reductase
MRVLILGASGMLGHKLAQSFASRFETFATARSVSTALRELPGAGLHRIIDGISAEDPPSVARALEATRPDAVVNCIGIVKQEVGSADPVASITVNALFPHHVANACREAGSRLVHLSTDCVFSGKTGNYSESDRPDAEDLYGRSKLLGEVGGPGCLTIRTSMIGRELAASHGLLEWFLSNQGGRVRGFTRAIFSGFTTLALARIIGDVLTDHPQLTGVWHVASDPIAKFDLLTLVKAAYDLRIEIDPDDNFVCDRSLDGSRFREATGFTAPSWATMIDQLCADPTPYAELRRIRATR